MIGVDNILMQQFRCGMKLNQLKCLPHARALDRSTPRRGQEYKRSSKSSPVLSTWHFIAMLVASSAIATAAPSTSWTQLFPATSPTPRSYPAMTYDATSRTVIMFGGYDGGYLNDTWTFDGTIWTRVTPPASPPGRTNAQMAYDRHTHKVVLFGGYNGTQDLGDTWLWDGLASTWTQAAPTHSPKAVTGPMVFTDANGSVDEFGGFDGNLYQGTMWQWNGSDWRQLHPDMLPYARSSAAVGVNTLINQVVMFGGLGDVNPNNTWTYDGTTWTMQSPPIQPPLVYASSTVFDPNLKAVVLFGGGSGGVDQNSTWAWTGSNWKQLVPTQSPEAREGTGIAYDVALGRVIIFGGQDGNLLLNDTWEFTP
ncbi:MAG TPA: kelch repeat-containing protein [Chthoniobacterales bacterium]